MSEQRCPLCGGRTILVEDRYVCAEFQGYKEDLANTSLLDRPDAFLANPSADALSARRKEHEAGD
jgi:hypothetical protein